MEFFANILPELDIAPKEGSALSLFGLLDRTRTLGGQRRLKDMCRKLPPDGPALEARQSCVRHLAESEPDRYLLLDDVALRLVAEYLDSGILGVDGPGRLESFFYRLLDRGEYSLLRYRLEEVPGVVAALTAHLRGHPELCPLLRALGWPVDQFLDPAGLLAVMPRFSRRLAKGHHLLQADRILRSRFKVLLGKLLELCWEIDALQSLAVATREHGWIFPCFREGGLHFEAVGLRHPFLADPVPADCRLDAESNLIFLTGPNMAGKTTFLKACGLAAYLAHLGAGVPADSLELCRFDRLFTSLSVSDDVARGYSFFFSEVRRMKELAAQLAAGKRVFALLDELFKGTNVQDAFDGTDAVIGGLAAWRGSAFLVSSHLWELAEGFAVLPNLQTRRFGATVGENGLVFDYRLEPGISRLRVGMDIIRREGVLELLASAPPADVPEPRQF
jgi:DNA mismatch repair ATPase MutS